jgi:quinolinate synthase
MILWQGSCMVHETFSEKKMVQLKMQHPHAEAIAHPECEPSILRHANYIGSTTALLQYAQQSPSQQFIVATEPGIIHQMQKNTPHKQFIPAPPINHCACNECPHMRLNTLEKLYLCMKQKSPELLLPQALQQAALLPIQRMLAMSP